MKLAWFHLGLILLAALALEGQVVVGGKAVISGKTVIGKPSSGAAIFTDIQGLLGTIVSSGTTTSVTLASNPTAGNAVVCAVYLFPLALTVTSVLDGNSNAYTQTPNSPSQVQTSATSVFLFYLLNAPANANKVITMTASGTITFASAIGCEEFHRSTGTWTFDTDVAGNGSVGTTVNTPSVTAAAVGELEFGAAYASAGLVSGGSANSPWSNTTMGPINSNSAGSCPCAQGTEMILSASGSSTAMNMTIQASTGVWNSMAMALK